MKIIFRVLLILSLIIALAWVYSEPGFEPCLAALGSICGLIATFFFGNKKEKLNHQNQQSGSDALRIIEAGKVDIILKSNGTKIHESDVLPSGKPLF